MAHFTDAEIERVLKLQVIDAGPHDVRALIEDLREARSAAREALAVLTEPGVMDVDQWKAWRRRTVDKLQVALLEPTP